MGAVRCQQGEHSHIIGALTSEQLTDRVRQMVVAHADGVRVPAHALQCLGNTPRAHAAHSV